MDQICPLCNGLYQVREICPNCGRNMIDNGKIEDYLGPYSPYMDEESFTINNSVNTVIGDNTCIHLLYCVNCNERKYISHSLQFF